MKQEEVYEKIDTRFIFSVSKEEARKVEIQEYLINKSRRENHENCKERSNLSNY